MLQVASVGLNSLKSLFCRHSALETPKEINECLLQATDRNGSVEHQSGKRGGPQDFVLWPDSFPNHSGSDVYLPDLGLCERGENQVLYIGTLLQN